MMTDLVGLVYAGFVIFGGIVGYVKAGSSMSLLSGLVFGSCATLASYLNNDFIMFVTSGTLTAIMGYRFYGTGKFIPPGIIALASLGVALRSIIRIFG